MTFGFMFRGSSKVSMVALLVALCIGSNYALIGVPNLKLMDFLVFVGGFRLGPLAGGLIGVLTWMVYGVLNPYGFVFPIWLSTMFSEAVYGVAGGILGRRISEADLNELHVQLSVLFGVLGFFLTLAYDLLTTLVYAATFSLPFLPTFIFGLSFTLLHELSNAAIFTVGSVPTIRVIKKLVGR